MKMLGDNKVSINQSKNLVMYAKTKHVDIDRHFIRKNIDSKNLLLSYVKFQNQIADKFTKGLTIVDYETNICKLVVFDMHAHLEGIVRTHFIL